MASLNKVMLIGNLGRDPEIRNTAAGQPIANLRVATSESWRDKTSGERMERTEWHSVVIFNENLAKIAQQYLRKGSKVFVEGQLATRKWTDQAGTDRYTTEIVLTAYRGQLVLLDTSEREAPSEDAYGSTSPKPDRNAYADQRKSDKPYKPPAAADLDDEIPF